MRKIYTKLIVIILQLVIAVSVVAMSSYAWMVLAANPAAEGIQITIGGGNTILVAADLSETVDGTTYHYPGRFSDTLNFGQNKSYDYLKKLGALTPVSTADGLNWFIPEYYAPSDPEVQSGAILSGTMKSIGQFTHDEFLKHANLSAEEEALIAKGSYIYLDFWVVSPGEDYTLRISTGNDSDGSFVVDLPGVVSADGGYALDSEGSGAAACVRVGLLSNSDDLVDNTMLHYQNSSAFDERYRKLRGAYTEPDSGWQVYSNNYRFTIYEPNGDDHPYTLLADDDTYVVTRPIGLVNGAADWVDISDRLTVQLSSLWTMAETGAGTRLEQQFQTALMGSGGLTAEEAAQKFYNDYLGGQVASYVTKGQFIKSTETLYAYAKAAENGSVAAEYLKGDYFVGATDDVYIVKLEKNIPQRIRMFIWLEGEDVDCVNGVSASSFALRVELAGSNMEETD